jgi:hypothetical protein
MKIARGGGSGSAACQIATISMSPIYYKKKIIYKKWCKNFGNKIRDWKKSVQIDPPALWNTVEIIINYVFFGGDASRQFNEHGEKFLYTF